VIRRLRDLGMPLDSIAAVLAAPDLEARNREIAAHLTRMERQLEQTQTSVAALRALLTGPAVRPVIELRAIAAVTALAVRAVVDAAELNAWGSEAFDALAAALSATGLTAAGPYGGLFHGDFFELERSEVTAFVPVAADAAAGATGLDPAGGVRMLQIPAVEAAVAVHQGAFSEIDRTYAAVGEVVAERAIGTGGPIREYYLVSSADTDDVASHRTEVCWPVFRTGA
jgi:effector-binding domain-containing protein